MWALVDCDTMVSTIMIDVQTSKLRAAKGVLAREAGLVQRAELVVKRTLGKSNKNIINPNK